MPEAFNHLIGSADRKQSGGVFFLQNQQLMSRIYDSDAADGRSEGKLQPTGGFIWGSGF